MTDKAQELIQAAREALNQERREREILCHKEIEAILDRYKCQLLPECVITGVQVSSRVRIISVPE